jgi:hypothetical protein
VQTLIETNWEYVARDAHPSSKICAHVDHGRKQNLKIKAKEKRRLEKVPTRIYIHLAMS